MANTVHGYLSQSDKGEMVIGGGTDGYNNYTQRGSFHHVEENSTGVERDLPDAVTPQNAFANGVGLWTSQGTAPRSYPKTPVDGVVHQLWLGHWRVQSDPRVWLGHGRADGQKENSPLTDEFGMETLHRGPLYR